MDVEICISGPVNGYICTPAKIRWEVDCVSQRVQNRKKKAFRNSVATKERFVRSFPSVRALDESGSFGQGLRQFLFPRSRELKGEWVACLKKWEIVGKDSKLST